MAPVLAALLRNRTGLFLLSGQIALTLAIVVNASFIAQRDLALMLRPSGLDEENLLAIHSQPTSPGVIPVASSEADVAALRALPGVSDAVRINCLPLGDAGWRTAIATRPFTGPGPAQHTAMYYTDERGPGVLGIQLVDGRSFRADEVGDVDDTLGGAVSVALISRALAEAMFPGESPLGRKVYSRIMQPITIVGVVERLQSAWPQREMHENSLLIPARLHLKDAYYLVRTLPGQRERVRAAVAARLLEVDPARVVDAVRSYDEVRAEGYRGERALLIALGALSVALLLITALGIGGTAVYWVANRRQQIGTRRALGARRGDIVRHFMWENFLITTAGAIAGGALTFGLNRWLMTYYDVPALAWYYPLLGTLLLYALGQTAVLGPALRAAAVPPAVATRGA